MRLRMRCVVVLSTALVLVAAGTAGGAAYNHYGRALRRTHPIVYWRLGQASGGPALPRVGKYVGKYRGAPLLGRRGLIIKNDNKAPRFDGRDDRVTADRLTSRSTASWANGYTLEAWVKTTTTSVEEHILSFNRKSGGANIAIFRDEPTNKFKFHDGEGSGSVSVFSKTTPVIGKTYQ
ncbi:MAG: LamG domain-containing protein, partial [Actinomycetota bacterium]|nr:LamG domain-containing protein [Actinomycetota bacterium]